MSTDQVAPFYFKTIPGMNNKTEELELNGKFVKLAQNCRFEDEPGAVSKRPPLSYYNDTPLTGTGGILGAYRYYGTANVKSIVAFDDEVFVGDDSAGTFTSIRTLGTSGYRMSFVTYKNLLIGGNGQDNLFCYDGSSDNLTWELGSCKAKVGSGTGITRDTISYQVTMDDDAYVCGAISNTISSVTNKSIDLSNIPLGPLGTTNRKIYRKDSNTGGAYKLVTTLSNNTATTYTDTTDDISAAAVIPAVNDDMPKGDILIIHRERLFVSGDPNQPNYVYYSNPFLPGYIQQTTNLDYLAISPEDGDEIMGLAIQMGTMMCLKRNTIRKLYVAASSSGADPETWYAEDPLTFIGTIAKWSVCQTSYGIIFLGADHWYLFDGAKPVEIVDEFDTAEILPSMYDQVVVGFAKGILYCGYSNLTEATQYNNRMMVYNFKRNSFSIDTINASAFFSRSGNDEGGELFIGSSIAGTLWKADISDDVYRLSNKTDCLNGDERGTYVGGLEASPYIEIGSTTSASAIPSDICIFWDNPDETPGTGWTEVTDVDRLVKISTTAGTNAGDSSHTHTVSGDLDMSTADRTDGGDSENNMTHTNHTHTISSQSVDSSAPFPRFLMYRVFKKNGTTTEYEFPNGSIVMWDQPGAPEGWLNVADVGYYIKISASGDGSANSSTHTHTFSISSNAGGDVVSAGSASGTQHAQYNHTHVINGTTTSKVMDNWELDYVAFRFIKKIGEANTWDGTAQYCYALYDSAGTPGNDWSDVSSTYNDKFLKTGDSQPATGATANASHTHVVPDTESEENTGYGSLGGYNTTPLDKHTHAATMTASSTSVPSPASRTFRLFKKILGKMKDFNTALVITATNGVWVSDAIELNAQELKVLDFNLTKGTSDTFTFFSRTNSTQALVDAETACTPNHTTDLIGATGHGMSNGDRVTISAASFPTGLSNAIMYYVVNKNTDDFQLSLTNGGSVVTFSDNGTAVTWQKWTDPQTISGSTLTQTANVWFKYCLVFTAVDTVVSNPKVYFSDTYVLKLSYKKAGTIAEVSVPFIYDTGFINYNEPAADKIFKKLTSLYTANGGSLSITWETENSTDDFTVDLVAKPTRHDTFFQSTAMGTKLRIIYYKNDLYDLSLKELYGLYTPQPIIV